MSKNLTYSKLNFRKLLLLKFQRSNLIEPEEIEVENIKKINDKIFDFQSKFQKNLEGISEEEKKILEEEKEELWNVCVETFEDDSKNA